MRIRVRPLTPCLLLALVSGWCSTAFAQRDLKNIPDPDPIEELKTFKVADGFEVNLYAADPLLAKPIQMNFDARGRLWIASSEIYPQIAPGQKANDKILVLEDLDGDGKADKTTIFADGLLIPTGVEPGDGGAYVANSTEVVHLQDTNGDGKADTRRVMLSGFGTEDTHHIIHTFRWGMDGALYFNQSIYIHSHVETPFGVRRLNAGGIWQFRPENVKLEVLCRGFVNTWGHHFDDWGQSFATDGAYGEGVNYVFPGSLFVTASDAPRILKGLNPGSPKHCGLEIVSGSHVPEDWRGNILTNDFRGHRVCRFVISEDGSGYASREQTELIKSNHVAFRPIDIKMGPDGAIYIADWYNPIIQHGEVDFRDPRRDHVHGRIWRVTAKGRPLVKRPNLVDASLPALLDELKSPESFNRHHAKRLLKERGAATVLPALVQWVSKLAVDDPQYEHHRLEGLWAYQSLDVVEPALLASLLQAKDHRARAAAVRVASQWHDRLREPVPLFAKAVHDEHSRVRLEAVRALSNFKDVRAAELAVQALDHSMDRFLDFAVWQTLRDLQPAWLPAVQAGKTRLLEKPQHLVFAAQVAGAGPMVPPLLQILRGERVPPQTDETIATFIGTHGGPGEFQAVLDVAASEASAGEGRRARLIHNLVTAVQARKVGAPGNLAVLTKLVDDADPAAQAAAVRAIGHWKVEAAREKLVALAGGGPVPQNLRQAAFQSLIALGGPESVAVFKRLAAAETPNSVRVLAAAAHAQVDLAGATEQVLEVLSALKPGDDPSPIFDIYLQRKEGPKTLTAALAEKSLPEDVAKMGARLARSTGRELNDLIAALNRAGGLTGGVKILTPEQMREMVAAVMDKGNAARGEAVFRRQDQACLRCHAIAGAGGLVGPDLASIGASAQVDYLVDSLLVPNKAIKENYHTLVVVTKAGKVLSGIKLRQNKDELVLRNAEDLEISIPTSQIDEQANGTSLMPAGLSDNLTQPEFLDLVRFLSELGKLGPYGPSKTRVARRWTTISAKDTTWQTRTGGQPDPLASEFLKAPATSTSVVYTQVSGDVLLAELPTIKSAIATSPLAVLQCQIDVTTPGLVRLKLPQSQQIRSLWIDDKKIPATGEVRFEFTTGSHKVTCVVETTSASAGFRCELDDVAGSKAQAQFVNGK